MRKSSVNEDIVLSESILFMFCWQEHVPHVSRKEPQGKTQLPSFSVAESSIEEFGVMKLIWALMVIIRKKIQFFSLVPKLDKISQIHNL